MPFKTWREINIVTKGLGIGEAGHSHPGPTSNGSCSKELILSIHWQQNSGQDHGLYSNNVLAI